MSAKSIAQKAFKANAITEEEYKQLLCVIKSSYESLRQKGVWINTSTVERPHGEWIKHIDNLYPEDSTEECPFCHEEQRLVGNDDNFCPNCGADMRGDRE